MHDATGAVVSDLVEIARDLDDAKNVVGFLESRDLAFEPKPAEARLTPGTRPSISLFDKRV